MIRVSISEMFLDIDKSEQHVLHEPTKEIKEVINYNQLLSKSFSLPAILTLRGKVLNSVHHEAFTAYDTSLK